MWQQYAIGLSAVVLMMVAWVAVQSAWNRAFRCSGSDPDALAARAGCGGGCGCARRVTYTEQDLQTPASGREERS